MSIKIDDIAKLQEYGKYDNEYHIYYIHIKYGKYDL